MEFKKYIYPLRKWWWLLVAATLVAAVSSFLVTLRQPPIYQARTTLIVGRAFEDPNPTASQFWLGQQLAIAYADIANREQVRNSTMKALNLKWLPSYDARAQSNSQMLDIVVTDTNPQVAQAVANELAVQLMALTPTSEGLEDTSRGTFVEQQLNTLEAQIEQTEEDISELQANLGSLTSARQINDTQNQIAALQGKLSTLQGNYAGLLANTQRGAVNSLSVIEPATLPVAPVGPNKPLSIAIAAVIGLVLASGAAYLLEYLDDTLKTTAEIQEVFGLPIIGYLLEEDGGRNGDEKKLIVAEKPRHPIAEAYRSLRTNLEFAAAARPLKTILVTSADSGEGKTSVASNLAMIISQADKKVILIDADLRKPSVHEFMKMTNENGVSDLFRGRTSIQNAMRIGKNERIAVITGGTPPPNPAELLASRKMDQVLSGLKDVADVVVVDGPPFAVSDAAILAAKVDGVIVVVRPGYTREAAARVMLEQLNRAGANIVGVVLNRIPLRMVDYYGGQGYLSYYGDDDGDGGATVATPVRKREGWAQTQLARGFAGPAKGETRAKSVVTGGEDSKPGTD